MRRASSAYRRARKVWCEMVADERLPVVCLDGVPELSGADWRGHAFAPGTQSSVRGAIGTTLLFYTVRYPEIASNEQARAKYQLCDHDYRDAELVVNGKPHPAVEAVDRDLHVRVCAAIVKGFILIAVVPEDQEIPGVKAVWPPEDARDFVQVIGA